MNANQENNWQNVVKQNVESLDFGVVQIIVHNSKVVQIERTQKMRFDTGTNNLSPSRKEQKP